ncbi:MAG: hypothetical protein ACLFT3_01530 [Cyclobacteriaceae bacterium]
MFQPNYSHQEKHIEVLAYLYIVFGVLAVGIGLVLAPVIAGSGAISGDENAIWVTSLVGGGFGFSFRPWELFPSWEAGDCSKGTTGLVS